MPLRAFSPDISAPSDPFRTDAATVRQVLVWYRSNNPRPSRSCKATIEQVRLHDLFAADFGDRLCADCRAFELHAWIVARTQNRSNWTRRRWNATIQRAFNLASELGLIAKNPWKGCRFPEGKDGRDWTEAEFRSLLRHARPPLRRFLVCIRWSGMRPGEIRELTRSDLRLETGWIVLGDHKTVDKTKSPRKIPFNVVLAKLFGWCLRENPSSARHILLNSFGKPWTTRAITKAIATVRRKAGLPEDVRMHGGRHYFATHGLMNGADLVEMMGLLGHRRIETTKRYIHLVEKDDVMRAAMAKATGQHKAT